MSKKQYQIDSPIVSELINKLSAEMENKVRQKYESKYGKLIATLGNVPRSGEEVSKLVAVLNKHKGNIGLTAKTTGYAPAVIGVYHAVGVLFSVEYGTKRNKPITAGSASGKKYSHIDGKGKTEIIEYYKANKGKASVNQVTNYLGKWSYGTVMKVLVDAHLYSPTKKKHKT